MSINVSQSFHRTSANAVDDTLTLTKAQMLAVNDNLMPNKYFTICQDDGALYLYDKSATPSVETGKFTKFEGGGGQGGGGITIDATLLASGWDSSTKQQTITFSGYETSMGGVIGMPTSATSAQKESYANAKINVVSQSGASFTFECDEIPSVDLPVTLYAGGSGGGSADFPSGGTTGQALVKASDADNDVEWGTVKKTIEDNGTAVTDRDTVNLTDFDVEDDDTNEKTNVSAHRLTASEMAEIMSTLPGATTNYPKYSTTEQVVGEWIDGKPIYQKTIDCGILPGISQKDVNIGVSDIEKIINIYGIATGNAAVGYNSVPLPYVNVDDNNNGVQLQINDQYSKIHIVTKSSAYTTYSYYAYVTIQYTKTTD